MNFVLAGNIREAKDWCQANNVAPGDAMCLTPNNLGKWEGIRLGRSVEDEDTVSVLGSFYRADRWEDAWRLMMRNALHSGYDLRAKMRVYP